MDKKDLKNINPFERETIVDDGREVFIITRYFIGSKNLDKVFQEILLKQDELQDKVS